MDDSTRNHYLTLLSWMGSQTRGLGDLLLACGSPGALLAASSTQLSALPAATATRLRPALDHWPQAHPRSSDLRLQGGAEHFIPITDRRYPPLLRQIPDPPPWLFCRGDPAVLPLPGIAIVGSRRASLAGLRVARELASALAGAGYSICSGMALGIDAAAHEGALQRGVTVAVLAAGLDRLYPARHKPLAERIARRGCLLSEFPPGAAPLKQNFPRRNRVISGLAQATIIVEAALPSGSLHTAASALEQGREVYVLPWSIYHPQGAGCLRLLRDGAQPITAIEDLGAIFPGVQGATAPGSPPPRPAGDAGRLLSLIGDGALSVESLHRASGISVGPLLVLLGELEVAGWLRRQEGCYVFAFGKPCQNNRSC
ncbi:MAG: DNA processing protein [Halieaceae bacterium]|jgi:DNA processing protein